MKTLISMLLLISPLVAKSQQADWLIKPTAQKAVISIQKMEEHSFNGQYLTFKGSMYRSMANAANPAVTAGMPAEDRAKLDHIPAITDVETFNELKQSALDYLQTIA